MIVAQFNGLNNRAKRAVRACKDNNTFDSALYRVQRWDGHTYIAAKDNSGRVLDFIKVEGA